MNTPKITVIGSLNIDLTTYTARLPVAGETLHATSFLSSPGGKGLNQATACAKLSRTRDLQNASAEVLMIGAVGKDGHGQELIVNLRESGVDVEGIKVVEEKTGVAVVLVEEMSGENRILLSAGANYSLLPSQFENFKGPLPDLMILQLEIPVATTCQILKTAKENEVPVLLNPAPAVKLPDVAYRGLEHLVLNETEAVILSGCGKKDVEDERSLGGVARFFHEKGVVNVIITLGGRGVFYSTEKGEQGSVGVEKVVVVDTTAAGDTFVGAYALEVVKGVGVVEAVRKANKAAARTIMRRGAGVSIPWADEL